MAEMYKVKKNVIYSDIIHAYASDPSYKYTASDITVWKSDYF